MSKNKNSAWVIKTLAIVLGIVTCVYGFVYLSQEMSILCFLIAGIVGVVLYGIGEIVEILNKILDRVDVRKVRKEKDNFESLDIRTDKKEEGKDM